MDVKDIMGIKGEGKATAKKSKGPAEKKPEGVSREVWQITKDAKQSGDALAPLVPSLGAGLKDKRKVQARNVAWSWQPFKNSARSDDLKLKHWVKTGVSGQMLPGSNGGDVGGDYAFSKYNKRVDMLMYNDEEYENLLQFDEEWTREETDHLFDLLQRFDLRFLIAKDRWEREKPRTVEEMKSRYYAVARRLVEARADDPEEAATHPIIRDPFDAQHEMERKQALSDQMERTNALEREEQAILDEVKAIEARRSAEAKALSARAGAVFSAHRLEAVRASVAPDEIGEEQGAGGIREAKPSLPAASGESEGRPPPGAYARGKLVVETAGEMALAAVGAGGARGVKRIEQAVEELGVKPPHVATRAVCTAWLELRREATEMLELRKKLAKRQEELCGTTAASVEAAGAAPAGAAAARVFQAEGLPDTPKPKTHEVPLGPDGQPIGIRPAKREQKRKMPARFDDAPPSPPRRSAEKRQKR